MTQTQTQTQQGQSPALQMQTTRGTDFERLLSKEGRSTEYVPFGATDPIRLSIKIVQDVIAVPTKAGRTCSDRDAIKFIAMCQTQRLNPFAGDAWLVGYDTFEKSTQTYVARFSLITSYFAFLKRAEVSPDYEGMESGIVIDKGDGQIEDRETEFVLPGEKCVGGWCRVYRKNRKPTFRRLSVEAMRPGYETPFWSPEKAPGQIEKCAQADALRMAFPTVLGGLFIDGELSAAIERLVPEARKIAQFDSKALVDTVPPAAPNTPPAAAAPSSKPEAEDDGDLGPQTQPTPAATKPEAPPADSAKAQLASLVTGEGFTFSDFQKWGVGSGNVSDADSMTSFDEVAEADAKRLLRAKTGLLRGLAQVRGGKEAE